MKSLSSSQGNILIALLFVVVGLAGWTAYKSEQKQQWEYMLQDISDVSFDKDINTLGKQGWELVFARRASSGNGSSSEFSYEIIFKRKSK